MSTDEAISAARRRFDNAAHNLAASVDVGDRIATDPSFPCDRSEWADARRAEMLVADLRLYREAEAALTAAVRGGVCEYCRMSIEDCRDDRWRFCCEDCTHPEPGGSE